MRRGPDGPSRGRDGPRRGRRRAFRGRSGADVAGTVDLHSHTIASDGALTPRDLVKKAVQHGVRVLAITDHDSTEGIAEALDEAPRQAGLPIIPGLEIN